MMEFSHPVEEVSGQLNVLFFIKHRPTDQITYQFFNFPENSEITPIKYILRRNILNFQENCSKFSNISIFQGVDAGGQWTLQFHLFYMETLLVRTYLSMQLADLVLKSAFYVYSKCNNGPIRFSSSPLRVISHKSQVNTKCVRSFVGINISLCDRTAIY